MSTPMNLGLLRNEVMAHGFDPIGFGSGRINQFLNDAQGIVCRRVQFDVNESKQSLPTITGVALYPQPSDIVRARTLRRTDLGRELPLVDLRTIDLGAPQSGTPSVFAVDGTNLHLSPTPDGVYPLELRYWRSPPAMVNDGDLPVVPSDYHRVLWYWAVKECYVAEDDMPAAQYWETQFNTALSQLSADLKFPAEGIDQVTSMWDAPAALGGYWT